MHMAGTACTSQCNTEVQHWRTQTDTENKPIHLVFAGTLIAIIHAECLHSYELHLHELGLNPDFDLAGVVPMVTGPDQPVPEP